MQKDLLIAGAMRSGKTLLSNELSAQFIHIQTDHIILALQRTHPNLGIGRKGASFNELCNSFVPFLIDYAFQLSSDQDRRYILDCHYVRPSDSVRFPASFRSIFLGYPHISSGRKVIQLRDYGSRHECYTRGISDSDLHGFATEWIAQCRFIKEECASFGVPFFDTAEGLTEARSYLQSFA